MRFDPWLINKQHLADLIELGIVEMREDIPYLTIVGPAEIGGRGYTGFEHDPPANIGRTTPDIGVADPRGSLP